MAHRWNWRIWLGFLTVLFGVFGYLFLFVWFPITRDIPWVSFLLFVAGIALLAAGLRRAFREPTTYRGKVFGPILSVLSLVVIGMFSYGLFYQGQMPAAASAPRVGQKAPDFTLPDQNGNQVSFSQLLSTPSGKYKGLVLIFYRGHWWLLCNSELRSFQQRVADFDSRALKIVAISVDPPHVTRPHIEKLGFTYTFLSDTNAQVIRAYDLLHPTAGPGGTDIARPAEFLIDSSGTVRWVNLTETLTVRARPEQVLKAAADLR